MTHLPSEKRYSSTPPGKLIDTWSVSVGIRVRGSLHVTQDRFFLNLSGGEAQGSASGKFAGIQENGWAYFNFSDGQIFNRRTYVRSGQLPYHQVDGFLIVDQSRGGRIGREHFTIMLTHKGNPIRNLTGNLTRIRHAGGSQRVSLGRNESRASFLYRDGSRMTTGSENRFYKVINTRRHEEKVQQFINSALNTGLNCGNVAEFVVRPGVVSRLKITRGHDRTLFKIVSPLGSDRLMYAIGSERSGGAGLSAPPDSFPSISLHRFTSQAFIDLWLLPDYTNGVKTESEVHVSIYYFSPNILASRRDCSFVRTSTFSNLFTLGKLYFAIMMESSRRDAMVDGKFIQEGIAIYGRDVSIKSALRDLFPMADNRALSFMTRNIGTLLQSGFDPEPLSFANWRERVIQELESHPGMKGEAYRFADILLDTSLFLGKSKN